MSLRAASQILNKTKHFFEILLEKVNNKSPSAVRSGRKSCRVNLTVLLSSEEKTDDARACAQSGHCPFKLHRFQAIFMGAFSRNFYLKFLAARTKLVINNAFPVQQADIYPVRRKCMTFGLKLFYFIF